MTVTDCPFVLLGLDLYGPLVQCYNSINPSCLSLYSPCAYWWHVASARAIIIL